jgi:DNA-binding winged helix-turn-helix (wHTH) protein
MIYRFGPFELDSATAELRARDEILSLEPQVFALLALLVENHDRLVSNNEIIEKVWDGRARCHGGESHQVGPQFGGCDLNAIG